MQTKAWQQLAMLGKNVKNKELLKLIIAVAKFAGEL
jgi:hypothetical protein